MSAERDSYAYFKITSDLPLSSIERYLGIVSDGLCWSKGDRRPSNYSIYNFSRWTMQSGIERGQPIDKHLKALWRRLSPLRDQIIHLPAEMNRQICCVGCFDTHLDDLQISAGHFAAAHSFGVTIDFDFYFENDFGDETKAMPHWLW